MYYFAKQWGIRIFVLIFDSWTVLNNKKSSAVLRAVLYYRPVFISNHWRPLFVFWISQIINFFLLLFLLQQSAKGLQKMKNFEDWCGIHECFKISFTKFIINFWFLIKKQLSVFYYYSLSFAAIDFLGFSMSFCRKLRLCNLLTTKGETTRYLTKTPYFSLINRFLTLLHAGVGPNKFGSRAKYNPFLFELPSTVWVGYN